MKRSVTSFKEIKGFFEESNNMLEQRNDSMQAVSSQTQAKLVSLENEKAKLSSDLFAATSKLSLLEGELKNSQSLENQLKQKLQEYEEKIERQSTDSDLETKVISSQQKLESAKNRIEVLTEQINDLQTQYKALLESNTTLEKLLEESQSKAEEIKTKTEKDCKELHDKEIRQYQEKLNQLSEKGDSAGDTKIELLREENEKLLKGKEELQTLVEELQKKLKTAEASLENRDKKMHELQSELDTSLAWKKKYEVFYERTRAMKEKYESQMGELVTEIKQLRAAGPPSPNFSGEIKKVMNVLFKMLQGKFDSNSSYEGSKVLEVALQSIRALTFQMLEMKSRASSSSSENDAESAKVVDNTTPSSGPSAAVESNSSESRESSLDGSAVSSDVPVQQNGLKDTSGPPSSQTLEVSGDDDTAPNASSSDSERVEAKSVEEAPLKQIECEQNGVDSSSDDSKLNEVSDKPIAEETKSPPKETKEVNRVSPDGRPLSPSSASGAGKV
ncbi:unnamed protein product [Larinioides sclopetarius]|uniref:FK506-binding protein 15-like domain-containing protein n=2 Tax=Larinioides sclopetarius TaxID=280406 RepID=A0AAV2BZX8_9ARAC